MNLHAARRLLDRTARTAFAALLVCGVLAGCVAPPSTSQPTGPASSAPASAPAETATPPVERATPAPAATGGSTTPGVASPSATPVKIDTTCRTNADCTVKNVGNCCGYYPACVNINSPTDPQGVQAECARSGRMSVCGFREINACQCVSGQCEAAPGGLDVQ